MLSHFPSSKRVIYSTIAAIIILLALNITLLIHHTTVMEEQRVLRQEAESVKVATVEVLRNTHILDLGLRGYALYPVGQMIVPFDSAIRRKQRYLQSLEATLRHQHFPMSSFDTYKASVERYFEVALTLRQYIEQGDTASFMALFRQDPGFGLARDYRVFSAAVNIFEDTIVARANARYAASQRFSYWLQVMVFIIAVPTLFYLAHYTNRTVALAIRLQASEAERTRLLEEQKDMLERKVQERTQELVALNEEITAQNEEIHTSNEQLMLQRDEIGQQRDLLHEQNIALLEAKRLIEEQNRTIANQNQALEREVDQQTQDLLRANDELKERNGRLEQFAYVLSHHLRAPLSRILGLSHLMNMSVNTSEIMDFKDRMTASARQLDGVVKDLSGMLEVMGVQRMRSLVRLEDEIQKVWLLLADETEQVEAVLTLDLQVRQMSTSPPYLSNILYCILSNALRFHEPSRTPHITIRSRSKLQQVVIEVEDNGMGIDLDTFGPQLFLPYKRFHLHIEGKGLGLYIARLQTEGLGGTLMVDSVPGQGSTFRMSFPQEEQLPT